MDYYAGMFFLLLAIMVVCVASLAYLRVRGRRDARRRGIRPTKWTNARGKVRYQPTLSNGEALWFPKDVWARPGDGRHPSRPFLTSYQEALDISRGVEVHRESSRAKRFYPSEQ